MKHCVLGIDLGTSALKAACVGADGTVLAVERVPYPMVQDQPGQMEQRVEDWVDALTLAVHRLRAKVPLDRVTAIGLCGQVPTLTVLRGGRPLSHAITWLDGRADAWTRARLAPDLRRKIYRQTGMPLDGRYLGPMYAFHYASAGASRQSDRVLSAKDFLFHWLTGAFKTDPATAAGYGVWLLKAHRWSEDLARLWHLRPEQLPDVVEGADAYAPLHADRAQALALPSGIPVHVGTVDSLAAALGAGGALPRTLTLVWGSSTAVIGTAAHPSLDPRARYLVTPHALPGLYALEADLLTTGAGLAWLSRLLGEDSDSLIGRATEARPGARGVQFAPYLAGAEQGAVWRDRVAGSITGLTLMHTAADIVRAFLEGVAYETRRIADLFSVRMGGFDHVLLLGAPAGDVLPTLLANVFGREVTGATSTAAAALGAAILSGATDLDPTDAEVLRALTARAAHTASPSPQLKQAYDALYARYTAMFPRFAETPLGAGTPEQPPLDAQ